MKKKEKNDWQDKYWRLAADFDNFRKTTEKRIEEVKKSGQQTTICHLLPVLDNLERAGQHLPEEIKNHNWTQGVLAIADQLRKKLAEIGVHKIPCQIGDQFNPHFHEAVDVRQNSNHQSEAIIEIIESGWQMNNQVIRPVKVIVNN